MKGGSGAIPKTLGPLDWVIAVDRRTGEKFAAAGKWEAGALLQDWPAVPLNVTIHTIEFDTDGDRFEIVRLVREAQKAWDKLHGDQS